MGPDRSPPEPGGPDEEKREVEALHRQVMRELPEPTEGREPAPWWVVALAILAVFGGGFYLGRHGGSFDLRAHRGGYGEVAGQGAVGGVGVAGGAPGGGAPGGGAPGGGAPGGAAPGGGAPGGGAPGGAAAPGGATGSGGATAGGGSASGATATGPDGAAVYASVCVPCHQATLLGLPGAFPPLIGSEWVTGDARVPVRIVLHGLAGPITVAGQPYNSAMPGWGGTLDDPSIAAVIGHVRAQAGVAEPEVPVALVAEERATGRTTPWTAAELER